MRNLLIALLALSISAHAAKTTLTGTINDAQGNPLNGTLSMKLPVPAQDPSTSSAIQSTPVWFNVVNGQISGGAQLYDVATIQPQKLWYTARAYDAANNLVFYGNYYVTGPTFNLGTATPTVVTTSNISYFNPGINNAISITANGAKCDGSTDDTASIQAAVNQAAAVGGPKALIIPPGTCVISAPINIPVGMTTGSITGYGQTSTIQAKAGFSGASMITSDATLSILNINGVRFDANNQAAITSVVNLTRTPESSINHRLTNITIVNIPAGATGITLDGCEDTYLLGSYITAAPGATGTTAIHWYVPSGNLHILGGIAFGLLDLQYQNADITGETFLGMKLNGANLVLNGGYVYVWDGATHSNIFGSGVNNITISGSYFIGSNPAITINNATAITGTLNGVIRIIGATFNSAGQTYSLFSSSTIGAGSNPPSSVIITGPYLASTTTTGTPGANVFIGTTNVPQTQEITAFFTTSTAVQLGTPMIFDYPVVVTRMMVTSSTVVAGCSTSAVVSLGPAAGIGATLTNGAQTFDSSAIAAIVPANTLENIQISTAAVGCSTAPANLQVSMQYHAR